MTASSETILRAAALMRSRALAATPSPWVASPVWSPRGVATSAVYSHAHPTGSAESEVVASAEKRKRGGGIRHPHDSVHIAGMQPSVALLMADWLERCGKDLASNGAEHLATCDEPDAVKTALGIARAYLRDGD